MTTDNKPTKREKQDFLRFLTYSVCFVALGVGVSSLGPILPLLSEQVGVTLGQISFVFTVQNLGYLIGSAGGGRLFDRFNGHRLMVLALLLMIGMLLLIPLMGWFQILLTVMFFFGLGLGMVDIGGNLNLIWLYRSRVTPYMNVLHFSFGFGGILAPIIIAQVLGLTGGSLIWAMWTLVIFSLPALFGLLLQKSPEPTLDKGSQTKEISGVRRLIFLVVLLFFLSVGVQSGFSGWIFTYVTEQAVADSSSAALMTSTFWGSMTLGRLLTVPVSKKVVPGKILLFNCSMTVVIIGLILIWPFQSWMMWIGAAGLGLATSSIFPTLMSFGESRMTMTGKITGLFLFGSSFGMMIVPMLLGQIFEIFSGYALMLTLFGISILGLLVMTLIYRVRPES